MQATRQEYKEEEEEKRKEIERMREVKGVI